MTMGAPQFNEIFEAFLTEMAFGDFLAKKLRDDIVFIKGAVDRRDFNTIVANVVEQSQKVECSLRQVPELKSQEISLDKATSGTIMSILKKTYPEILHPQEFANIERIIAERNWVLHNYFLEGNTFDEHRIYAPGFMLATFVFFFGFYRKSPIEPFKKKI